MGWHRVAKFSAFNVFRKITSHNPTIRNSIQRTHTSLSPPTVSPPKWYPGPGYLHGIHQERLSPFVCGARRYYYRDHHRLTHFWQRCYRMWLNNQKEVVLIGTGIAFIVYVENMETIPYNIKNRTHLHLLSPNLEKQFGETLFELRKRLSFKGKILPAIHPESARIRLIAKDIFSALHIGGLTDLGYALEDIPKSEKVSGDETLSGDNNTETTEHLEAFNWEILVLEDSEVNACFLPGGTWKIVIFTGLLEKCTTDDEIATVIGHEVAHALARHFSELWTINLGVFIVQLILLPFITPYLAFVMPIFFLGRPYSRMVELEADYIGLLLTASAGYDPRVAPGVYTKLNEINSLSWYEDYLSTHPSKKKRARLLAESKIMEEALLLYGEAKAGRGIEGFL